ncbi:hypothetical protein [uncultured Aquimarina sp.]|uniref:hypothetical protein n=1 Tax=uncultured Aquimarina sp. TaxID=575652 RepID=UPI00261D7F0D|nr:hypothetical protein [uncultured Aquimarina sp.]
MSIEEDILIQNFLKNTLSEKERREVLSKIAVDSSFREKVNFEKQLLFNLNNSEWSLSNAYELPEVKEYEELLKSSTTQELKSTLSNVNTEYQNRQKKKMKSWWLYSGAAMILTLIGLSTFLLYNSPSNKELYTNYINLSDLPSLVDRGTNNQTKLLVNAQKLFEAKQYKNALQILTNDLDSIQQNKAIVYLYTGISQMELNQFTDAEKTFDKLINSKLIDAPKGTWYKALLYIKLDKVSKAKELLFQISQNPSTYKSKEASELLDTL